MVIDPADESVRAEHTGGLTVAELIELLERSAHAPPGAGVDALLQRGDALAGAGKYPDAAVRYREALRIGGAGWPGRARAVDGLTSALVIAHDDRQCADVASTYAGTAPRDRTFVRIVATGLSCANSERDAAWAVAARRRLEALGVAGLDVRDALRDNRFFLWQQLIIAAQLRHDGAAHRLGERWLAEIDAATPANDDERSALDIARVDVVALLDEPERALPALAASERAMPRNYSAAMRHAEVAADAKHWDEALAACAHGLALVDGPMARTRLLWIEARALIGRHDAAGARRALDQALESAQHIRSDGARAGYVARIGDTRATLPR